MKTTLLFFSLCSFNIYSQTFLCTAEAGAGVSNTGENTFNATVYNVSDKKFILTKTNEKWVLKIHGSNSTRFDNCTSEFYCGDDDRFSGVFLRSTEGDFTYVTMRGWEDQPKKFEVVTMKGICSEI